MSLTGNKVDVVGASSAATNLSKDVAYMAYLGASMVAYRRIIATSFNNTQSTFVCNPPSPQTIWDRNDILVEQPVTLDFVGTTTANRLLQSGYDAFRAMPVHSVSQNVQLSLNGSQFNLEAEEVVHEIMRFHGDEKTLENMSGTPAFPDQSQEYSELVLTNRNPLAQYGEKTGVPFRGGFPYTAITNPSATGANTAQVQATLTEPLMVSPAAFADQGAKGFVNVQNAQVTFNWSGNLARMWSHAVAAGITLTSVTPTMRQPAILCRYLTPSPMRAVPRSVDYALDRVEVYPTDLNAAQASGAAYQMTSNNLQLSVIPAFLMVFAKERRGDRTFTGTDSWQSIEGIPSMSFANNSGIMSGASKQQLYEVARENGVKQSWAEWSGEPTYFSSGASMTSVNGTGGPLILRPGKDFGMADPSLAPGVPGTFNLQITVDLVNRNPTRPITPALYIVAINSGIVTLEDNQAIQQMQVISQEDVIDANKVAQKSGLADAPEVSGGTFFGDLKKTFETIAPPARMVRKILQKIAGVAQAVPAIAPEATAAKSALDLVEQLGLGDDSGKGKKSKKGKKGGTIIAGRLLGGKQLSRAQLKNLQKGAFS